MRRTTTYAMTLAAVALAACRDALAPDAVAGRWALREVGGAPLPVVRFVANNATIRTLADTLRLGADGRGTHVEVQQTTLADGTRQAPTRRETELWHRVAGERLEITHVCPPNANCVAGPHLIARRAGAELVVDAPAGGARHVYAAAGGG